MTIFIIASILVLIAIGIFSFFQFAPQIGGKPVGERAVRMKNSPHYRNGIFYNQVATNMDMPAGIMAKTVWKMLTEGKSNEPASPIHNLKFNAETFLQFDDAEVVVTWFGHSAVLIKIEGKVFLVDPVFGERASMFSFLGPKPFNYLHPLLLEDLPPIDAIILSHDHYDHLGYRTISALKGKVDKFYMPLGVGAHLEKWGIDSARIFELDWHDSIRYNDKITLTSTPCRHFSGRGFKRFQTLWCSWIVRGQKQTLFFGADSGYYNGFKAIGDQYGPFDLVLLESGAYNENWADIHMMPEDTVQASLDLKGKVLLPIHWGKFNLALHHWKEPIIRLTNAAAAKGVEVITPSVGESVILNRHMPKERWWEAEG